MRIILIFLLSIALSFASLQAQTHTYDIKYPHITNADPGGFGDFQQISPTRLLVAAGSWDLYPFLLAIDNEGMIVHKWKFNFKVNLQSFFYRYDKLSNTLVCLTVENVSNGKYQQRLVLLDSNLTEKSNVILDSSQTGLSTVFNSDITFKGILFLDSTILWMSYKVPSIKGQEQIALHLSRDGNIISRTSIIDTSRYIGYQPLFQMPSGKIIQDRTDYNPNTKRYYGRLVTSDTLYNFTDVPVIDTNDLLYGFDDILPTKDSGIVLAYYYGSNAAVIKYDKNFKKQWTTYVPAGPVNTRLKLIESRNGGYYITTEGNDTVALRKYIQFSNYPSCFQDIILSYIDTSGRVLFSSYYGTEMCNEEPYDMVEDYTDGGIIITGDYNDNRNNSPCESFCDESNINWLFKVDSLGEPSKRKSITGVSEKNDAIQSIRIYPNPASGILTVDFGKPGYFTDMEIISMNGNIHKTISLENNITSLKVDISSFESGNYFCRLRTAFHSVIRPFIIQK